MEQDSNIQVNKLRSILTKYAESDRMPIDDRGLEHQFSETDIDILINELQIQRFELEMQNDELKVSYEALDAEREKFAGIYKHAPVGYFILDHIGVIEDVNQTGLDLLNQKKESIQCKTFQSFVAERSLNAFYAFLQKIQTSDRKQSQVIRLQVKDDGFVDTRIEGVMIQSVIASQIRYYITVIDISESRAAEQALREAKERLEMTLKASSTGIWNIEYGTGKIDFDDYSYKILGLDRWAFDGSLKSFFRLVHPEDYHKVKNCCTVGLNESTELNIEFRIIKDAGIRYIAVKGQQIALCEERKSFSGIVFDVTERKKLEREAEILRMDQQRLLLSATFNAQEKERNRISRALHDSICQLLYGIRLSLQSMPYYKTARTEFKNVNKLLDLAIKETRDISYTLMPSVLKDFGFVAGIKEMAQRSSTSQFLIKTDISERADRLSPTLQLYAFRIIQELVNNSMKHAQATTASIRVSIEDSIVSITVADNGLGFGVEMKQALTQGSGLRSIKNQVFLLRGEVSIEVLNPGTQVNITFNKDTKILSEDTLNKQNE